MRVVHPSVYKKHHERGRRGRRIRRLFLVAIVLVIGAYGGLASQVEASYAAQTHDISIGRQFVDIPWPSIGSASVGYVGSTQSIGHFNGASQLSSASTIKVLTALVLLNSKPLIDEGELIVFDEADEAHFAEIQSAGGAAVLIPAGSSITYKRALEILLIASANNVADKLAVWGFGSMGAYIQAATVYAADNGLKSTIVADASGLSAESKSSANDLLKLGLKLLENDTLKKIVSTESITLATGQVIENTNLLLGAEGFSGLKTGFTDEAGACLIASKSVVVGGETIEAVTVIMGQPDRTTAYAVSRQIMDKFLGSFAERSMLVKGQPIGEYISPWGAKTPMRVRDQVLVVTYEGMSVSGVSNIEKTIGPAKAGTKVGVFRVNDTEVEVELAQDLPEPDIRWRLLHVVDYIRQKV